MTSPYLGLDNVAFKATTQKPSHCIMKLSNKGRAFIMKRPLTELVFILDRSGSMAGLESDTIGGFNALLKKQKDLGDPCILTTVLFDNGYELLHDRMDIRAVEPITPKEYSVGGSTALLDAIGKTVQKIEAVQRHSTKDFRAEKVMFVIITDGQENASRIYSSAQIKNQIERQKTQHGWEFIFLGANIDAVETAGRFGISADRAADYVPDGRGTALNFQMMSETVSAFRQAGSIPDACLNAIRCDMKKRGRRK